MTATPPRDGPDGALPDDDIDDIPTTDDTTPPATADLAHDDAHSAEEQVRLVLETVVEARRRSRA